MRLRRADPNWQGRTLTCKTCGGGFAQQHQFHRPKHCDPCNELRVARYHWWESMCGRSEATNAVHLAIRLGELPKLDGTVACVDCGAPARDYDHRDYNRPLDVEPVCRGCNVKRGSAVPHVNYIPWPGHEKAREIKAARKAHFSALRRERREMKKARAA